MRLLVCGGRSFCNKPLLTKELTKVYEELGGVDVLISGGARGADRLAELWAQLRAIRVERFLPEWDVYGRGAGYVRNRRMLQEGKPDLVVAFSGGAGTKMMVHLARTSGVEVREVV